jgi:hypothetical protein
VKLFSKVNAFINKKDEEELIYKSVKTRSKVNFFPKKTTEQKVEHNWDTFMVAYNAVHKPTESGGDLFSIDERLAFAFNQLVNFWNYVDKKNSGAFMATYGYWKSLGLATILERHKSVWLFVNVATEDFEERAQNLIIELDNKELTISDYAVLLYLSYQDEETRKTFEDIPLAMLHDMLDPLADQKISEWFGAPYPMTEVKGVI